MMSFAKKVGKRLYYSSSPEVCYDIAEWAYAKNIDIKTLSAPVHDEVISLLSDDIPAQQEFISHKDAMFRSQSLVAIEKAFVRDTVGFVELPDGKIIYEGNWWIEFITNHPSYKKRFYLRNRYLKGNWYSLLCLWSSEYYHWFHDVLPRLETALEHLPNDTKFLINEDLREYQLESLKAYGIGINQLEIQPQGLRTCVERLWFSTPVGHTSLGSGKVIKKVAGRLINHFVTRTAETPLMNIYISRKKAGMRRLLNEDQLSSVIKDKGYEVIALEDLSWVQQLNLFFHSKELMGPHGVGLVNMMFIGHKNSHITEITAQSNTVPCYLVLARQLGHSFRRIHALPLGERAGDMYLPPESLDQI